MKNVERDRGETKEKENEISRIAGEI